MAIIGGGYTGLSAAYHLKKADPSLDVVVLEAETVGFGASGRNAGFVMTLKKPAPQPARGNILYNQLLREQIARRNAEIAQENIRRRQQVALRVVPVGRAGGGR